MFRRMLFALIALLAGFMFAANSYATGGVVFSTTAVNLGTCSAVQVASVPIVAASHASPVVFQQSPVVVQSSPVVLQAAPVVVRQQRIVVQQIPIVQKQVIVQQRVHRNVGVQVFGNRARRGLLGRVIVR